MHYPGFLIFVISVLIALSIHEAAHAWAAHILGDDTAKKQGRLSLDPRKHLDIYGTLMFLFAGIGWGKPVPVDPVYFKNPKLNSSLISFRL